MRRAGFLVLFSVGLVLVASPASAFAHNAVHTAWLYTLLDVLTLAVVTAPLWTAWLWGARRRGLLLALIAVVQAPVAVIGFVPIATPWLHLAPTPGGCGLPSMAPTSCGLTRPETWSCVWAERRSGCAGRSRISRWKAAGGRWRAHGDCWPMLARPASGWDRTTARGP